MRETQIPVGPKSAQMINAMIGVRIKRPTDAITRGATVVEQAAEAPVIITAVQKTPGAKPRVNVTPLPGISPLDVQRYDLDRARGIVYPVLKKKDTAQRPLVPTTYGDLEYEPGLIFGPEPGAGGSYWGDNYLSGFGNSDLAGWDDIVGTAVKVAKKVKKVVVRYAKAPVKAYKARKFKPIAKIKEWKKKRKEKKLTLRQAQEEAAYREAEGLGPPPPGTPEAERADMLNKVTKKETGIGYKTLLENMEKVKGQMTPDQQALMDELLAAQEYAAMLEMASKTDPTIPPPKPAGALPSWAIPAGVGLVAYMVLKK